MTVRLNGREGEALTSVSQGNTSASQGPSIVQGEGRGFPLFRALGQAAREM